MESESSPNSIVGLFRTPPADPMAARNFRCASIPRASREMSSMMTTIGSRPFLLCLRKNASIACMPGRVVRLPVMFVVEDLDDLQSLVAGVFAAAGFLRAKTVAAGRLFGARNTAIDNGLRLGP